MKKLNIFLVDDHKLFREGMKLLLSMQSFVNRVYEASSGKEFLDSLPIVDCDVVLMDIEMPEMNGIEAVREAMSRKSGLRIIALTMYSDDQYFNKMLDVGVKGYVLKSGGIDRVIEAIKRVAEGDFFFSEELQESWNRRVSGEVISEQGAEPIDSKIDLSSREMEILYYVCKGLSNQEIADQLFISKRTVDKHRANLLLKTGCRNTAALIIYAVQNRIINLE